MGSHKDKLETAPVLCAAIVFFLGIPSGLSAQSTQTTTGVDVGNVVEVTRQKADAEKPKDSVAIDPKSPLSPNITIKGEIKTNLPIKDPTGHLPQQVGISGQKVIPVTGQTKQKAKPKPPTASLKKTQDVQKTAASTKPEASEELSSASQATSALSQSDKVKVPLSDQASDPAKVPEKSPWPLAGIASVALLAIGGAALALTGGAKFVSNFGVPNISAEGHLGEMNMAEPAFEEEESAEDVPMIGYVVAVGAPKISLKFIEDSNEAY